MNFYMHLIMQRAKEEPGEYPAVFAHNTFFWGKLRKEGYASVRRWTRKVDIFAQELVLVPLHLPMHWTMAVINVKERAIEYYDSLHGREPGIFRLLLDYVQQEHADKKGAPLDVSGWRTHYAGDCPAQQNGYDCGIFACQFGEWRSRGVTDFAFGQPQMVYFRHRMVHEILSGKLMV